MMPKTAISQYAKETNHKPRKEISFRGFYLSVTTDLIANPKAVLKSCSLFHDFSITSRKFLCGGYPWSGWNLKSSNSRFNRTVKDSFMSQMTFSDNPFSMSLPKIFTASFADKLCQKISWILFLKIYYFINNAA